jgi:hypothetical protein
MSAADILFISGATGVNDAAVNGVYDRTSATSDGYALYAKRGDKSMCMEHFGGNWQVKSVSAIGKDNCFAKVSGGCGAEACTSRQWMVWDGKTWAEAHVVKMVAGAEAQRQVGCCCLHAHQNPLHHPALHAPAIASSHLFLFLRRALSMPPLLQQPLPPTTRELCPCSSAEPQALMLQ